MTKYFAWRGCEDPEQLADETILRLVSSVRENQDVRAAGPFTYGIAAHVFMEYLRNLGKQRTLKNELTESMSVLSPFEGINDCQRQCWDGLDRLKQALLKKYVDEEHPQDLAKSMGMTLNALRLLVFRIRRELKDCYNECKKRQAKY